MTRRNRDGGHYKPKKAKAKEYYSLRSLVPEITGVSVGDIGFDAARKAIERIVQTFQSLDGIDKGKLQIHRDLRDGFVKVTKSFYESNEFKDILAKFRNDEKLSVEEHDLLIEHFLEASLEGMSEAEGGKLKEAVEHMKGDEYYKKRDQIEKLIVKDMEVVDEVKHYPTKLDYMDQYVEILNQALQEWRQNVQYNILYEQAYERIVKKEPHLRQFDPLSADNMTPELLTKIMVEVLHIQHEIIEGTDE